MSNEKKSSEVLELILTRQSIEQFSAIYFRLYNQIPATYESASSRQFLRGRTETIRSASDESQKFVEALVGKAGKDTVKKLLGEAIKAHKRYGAEVREQDRSSLDWSSDPSLDLLIDSLIDCLID